MAKNKKSTPLNAADIRKHLNGEAIHTHEIEKKLLSDPLASDALDGFEALEKDKINLSEVNVDLKNRLQSRIQGERKSRMLIWRNISIAASLVAIFGLSYVYFKNLNTDKPQQAIVTKQSEKPINTKEADEAASQIITAEKPEADVKIKPNVPDKKEDVQPDLAKQVESEEIKTNQSPISDADMVGSAKADKVASAPVLARAEPAHTMQIEKISGSVVDADNQPIIGAIVKTKNRQTSTQTDNQGNFTIIKENDDEILEISAMGYKSQKLALENTAKNKIVLGEDASSLSEIVVTKRKTETVPQANIMQITEPKPRMGWDNFDDMLRNSVKQTGAVTTLRFDDPITVRVMVETNGRVSKVEVQSPEISKEDSEKIAKNIENKTQWFPARKSGKKIRKLVSRKIKPAAKE